MPKVVTALEQMELLAMKNERENTTVDDLRATIHQLEMDKQERTEDRIKYEKVTDCLNGFLFFFSFKFPYFKQITNNF